MAYKQLIGSRQKNTDTTFRIKNGDPVKNKNGKGVKPYQAIDMSDYNRRQQMRSDSLAVFNASKNIKNLFAEGLKPGETFTKESTLKTGDMKGVTEQLKQLDDFSKFKKDLLVLEKSKVKPTSYSEFWNKKRVENLPIFSNPFAKKSNTSKDVLAYTAPNYDKPKQEILLPIATKNKSIATKSVVKKKPRPKDTISKMPMGKLKSKSTTPKKLSSRKPENFVYYDKPKKTNIAITGHPGSKAKYATVNRGDKKGTTYLTKDEYDKEMKNKFIKIN